MADQRIILIVTVFIVIVSSSVSFADPPAPPEVGKWKCHESETKLTGSVTNYGLYKAVFYKSEGKETKLIDISSDGEIEIAYADLKDKKVTIQFGPDRTKSLVSSKLEYSVNCFSGIAEVIANIVASPEMVVTYVSDPKITMTLNPPNFKFGVDNKITATLDKKYQKATFKSCEVIGNDASPSKWIQIHTCADKSPTSLIKNIKHTAGEDTLKAELQVVSVPGSTMMQLRCEFVTCVDSTACSADNFETTYGTDGNCLST